MSALIEVPLYDPHDGEKLSVTGMVRPSDAIKAMLADPDVRALLDEPVEIDGPTGPWEIVLADVLADVLEQQA